MIKCTDSSSYSGPVLCCLEESLGLLGHRDFSRNLWNFLAKFPTEFKTSDFLLYQFWMILGKGDVSCTIVLGVGTIMSRHFWPTELPEAEEATTELWGPADHISKFCAEVEASLFWILYCSLPTACPERRNSFSGVMGIKWKDPRGCKTRHASFCDRSFSSKFSLQNSRL